MRAAVVEVAPQTQVIAPVSPASNRRGHYAKTEFTIDLQARTITCPAGQAATILNRRPSTPPDRPQSVTFPVAMCAGCALRSQCVGESKGPRHITLAPDEAALQAERRHQLDPSWREHYCQRSRVEHANRLLTAHGGRVSRYWGQAKTAFQLLMVSVVVEFCTFRSFESG